MQFEVNSINTHTYTLWRFVQNGEAREDELRQNKAIVQNSITMKCDICTKQS